MWLYSHLTKSWFCFTLIDMNITNIDLNLYKPFIAVYESRNITKAADKLVLTKAAVGMRIRELERQLDCKLFIPHARGVHTTKEADALYAKISSVFSIISDMQSNLKELSSDSVGTLRIGCKPNIAKYFLVDAISSFIKKYPKIKTEIKTATRPEFSQMLCKRDLDIVISRLPFNDPEKSFTIEHLADLPKGFFAHPEFMRKNKLPLTLTVEQLEGVPFIFQSHKTNETNEVVNLLGKRIKQVSMAGDNEFTYALVKREMGIGYVNACCVDLNEVVPVTIQGIELPQYELGVIYHKGESSKLILAFLDELKSLHNKKP